MKKLIITLTSIVLLFNSSLQAYSSNPKDFVKELVSDAISKLSNNSLAKKKNQNSLKKLLWKM